VRQQWIERKTEQGMAAPGRMTVAVDRADIGQQGLGPRQ